MNQTRHCLICWWVLGLTIAVLSEARCEEPEITDDEIAGLVDQVTRGDDLDRRDATDKLLKLADRAVTPVAVAAETEDQEESARCFDVLARMAASTDAKTAEAATDSLKRLNESNIRSVAQRAKSVLRLKDFLRQRAAVKNLLGRAVQPQRVMPAVQWTLNNGVRQIQVTSGDEQIEISDLEGKSIELKHTRSVDGKMKTDEVKAANLDDLRKKDPDAAKLYERYTGGQVIAGGGIPLAIQVQVGGPGALAVRPVPEPAGGPIPPNPPAEYPPFEPTGPRKIRAEQEGRTIEITDEDGMQIRVKIVKTIDGKEVSQEFAAQDLKTLAQEFPEAAKLYKQYAGRTDE